MANRRLARPTRKAQKRKLRLAKKDSLGSDGNNNNNNKSSRKGRRASESAATTLERLRKERSALLKRHARERVALRTHVRSIEDRRSRLRRGANVKAERRQLGAHVRTLKAEQRAKHAAELAKVEAALAEQQQPQQQRQRRAGAAAPSSSSAAHDDDDDEWQDVSHSDEDVDEDEVVDAGTLQDMFAHLTA